VAAEGRAGGRFDAHGVALRSEHGFYTYHGERLHRFEAAPYRWRSGWAYRRWDVGYRFPREYWLRDYYIDDFGVYGLEAPAYGLQWIRYGPDILLINLETGEVAEAVYGAFPG
jgi:Ni/Co efflux regulator RcnB